MNALKDIHGCFDEPEFFEELPEEDTDKLTRELFAKYDPIPKMLLPTQWVYENACEEKDGYCMEDAMHQPDDFQKLLNQDRMISDAESLNQFELSGLAGGESFMFENDEGKRIIKKMSDLSYISE